MTWDAAVQKKAAELRLLDLARALNASLTAQVVPLPVITALSDFLAVPDEPVRYRVDGLMPVGSRVLLAAQFKAGKSSMVGNLIRSVADSVDFLGHFPVEPLTGSVVLIDDELDQRTLRRWLRDQGVRNVDRVHVVSLRGRVGEFNLTDPTIRARWATVLRAANTGLLIFDCLRPVLDALGLSEDKESGRFLVAFDALLEEAGIGESVIVHHMGHNGERSRGDSRLRDWPDAEWRIVRQTETGEELDPAAPRFLSAYGRDVDVAEGALTFDPLTRHLTFAGGNRKQAREEVALPSVLSLLAGAKVGLSGAAIEAALSGSIHGRSAVRSAIKVGVDRLKIVVEDGKHGAHLHSLNPSSSPPRQTSPQRGGEHSTDLASSPIGASGEEVDPGNLKRTLASGELNGPSQTNGAERHPCSVCGRPIHLHNGRTICDRRDAEHQAARDALASGADNA